MEPSRPASGITRRTASPKNDMMSLNTPIMTMHAMPTCHASTAASFAAIVVFATMNAGPSTVSAMPIVDGASGTLRESHRHDAVDDVAEQHAERGAREHARVHELRRKSETGDENDSEH